MANPAPILVLLGRSLGGLHVFGRGHRIYAGYLLVQACIVVLWWPKLTFTQALETHDGPDPLLAVVIAVALSCTYFALRWGGEEIEFPGQVPMGDVRGNALVGAVSPSVYIVLLFVSQLVQSVFALALSLPIVLTALVVGGGTAESLAWGLLSILPLALFFRLSAALIAALLAPHRPERYLALRVYFFVLTIGIGFGLPDLSHVVFSFELFSRQTYVEDEHWYGIAPGPLFVGAYLFGSAVLTALLWVRLSRRGFVEHAPGA